MKPLAFVVVVACAGVLLGCGDDAVPAVGLRPLSPSELQMVVSQTAQLRMTLTREPVLDETILVDIGGSGTGLITVNPNPISFTAASGASRAADITAVTATAGQYVELPVGIRGATTAPGETTREGVIPVRNWRIRIVPAAGQ